SMGTPLTPPFFFIFPTPWRLPPPPRPQPIAPPSPSGCCADSPAWRRVYPPSVSIRPRSALFACRPGRDQPPPHSSLDPYSPLATRPSPLPTALSSLYPLPRNDRRLKPCCPGGTPQSNACRFCPWQ